MHRFYLENQEGGVNYKFIFRLESNQSKGMQSTLSSIELFPFLSTINSKFLPLLPQPRKFCDLRRRLGIGSIRQFPLPPAWDLVDRGTGATSEEPIHHTVLRRLLLEYNGWGRENKLQRRILLQTRESLNFFLGIDSLRKLLLPFMATRLW